MINVNAGRTCVFKVQENIQIIPTSINASRIIMHMEITETLPLEISMLLHITLEYIISKLFPREGCGNLRRE